MATRFVNIDRDTPLLLPPDRRDWVPADRLAHFVIDAVEALDLRQVKVNSYERAGQMLEPREGEVQQLLAKAEQADATPLQDGLTIPGEIVRRPERKAALEQARAEIEARAKARYAVEGAEHEKKLAALGFRHFLLRGLEKVSREWTLVTLAYNFKRLYYLGTVLKKA